MKRYIYEPKRSTITDVITGKTVTMNGKDCYELEKELVVASTMNVTYMTNEGLRQDVLDRYFNKC